LAKICPNVVINNHEAINITEILFSQERFYLLEKVRHGRDRKQVQLGYIGFWKPVKEA
jgi:hypothetical protein